MSLFGKHRLTIKLWARLFMGLCFFWVLYGLWEFQISPVWCTIKKIQLQSLFGSIQPVKPVFKFSNMNRSVKHSMFHKVIPSEYHHQVMKRGNILGHLLTQHLL